MVCFFSRRPRFVLTNFFIILGHTASFEFEVNPELLGGHVSAGGWVDWRAELVVWVDESKKFEIENKSAGIRIRETNGAKYDEVKGANSPRCRFSKVKAPGQLFLGLL